MLFEKKYGSTIKLMLFSVCSFVLMYNWCNTQKINKLNSFIFTNFQQKTTNFIHIDLNFLPGEKENSSNSLFITKLSSLNNQANIRNKQTFTLKNAPSNCITLGDFI